MLEKLQDKKKGDPFPGAGHVNALNEAARKILQTPSMYGGNDYPPWKQQPMQIVSEQYPLGQAMYLKRVYEIRPMFYGEIDEDRDLSSDSSNEVDIADDWNVDSDATVAFLDASRVGRSFALNDVVVAYFDIQRGMWVPLGESDLACCCDKVANKKVITETGYSSGPSPDGNSWPGVLKFSIPAIRSEAFYLYRAMNSVLGGGGGGGTNHDSNCYYSNIFELDWEDSAGTPFTTKAWWVFYSDSFTTTRVPPLILYKQTSGVTPVPLAVYASHERNWTVQVLGSNYPSDEIKHFDPLESQRFQLWDRALLPPGFKDTLPKYVCVEKIGPVDIASTAFTELFGTLPVNLFIERSSPSTTQTLTQLTAGASKLDCYIVSNFFVALNSIGCIRAVIDDTTLQVNPNKIRFEVGGRPSRAIVFEEDFSRPLNITVAVGSTNYRFYE